MAHSNETSTLQTLDRGLHALSLVAESPVPITIDELAAQLGLHRSITYRLVRTLEDHRLIERDIAGCLSPGLRLAALARPVRSSLRVAAAAELTRLADDLQMTAFLVVADAGDAVTIESAEPTGPGVRVVYQPGHRHPLDRGAPGMALCLDGPANAGERPELTEARRVGWATSANEVLPGMAAVAVPVRNEAGVTVAAIAVVWPSSMSASTDVLAARLVATALAIRSRLD